ncbi:MAG: Ribosomal large subunit pseudouridine synthase C [Verrucomicrobia bacterium ADurb.Bin345]|nr:MAG: Ribosomal large subunit pseudouridine synthase C [Verrucomicrobia bacterium ADurb.Bin345]
MAAKTRKETKKRLFLCLLCFFAAKLSGMSTLPPVIYEDEWVIAFDKPSGLLVAPDRWDPEIENLIQLVHDRLSPHYFNVHRIDKDTSGIVLCAKTKSALDSLSGLFQAGRVRKHYVALTRGVPAEEKGSIVRKLAPDPRKPGLMRVWSGGKRSETEYEVREKFRRYALMDVRPLTGRTHQIRVHLAAIRCPVVCDAFYGDGCGLFLSQLKRRYKQKKNEPERPLIGRLALHAESLTFRHPGTGKEVQLHSPLPRYLEVGLKYLRRFDTPSVSK